MVTVHKAAQQKSLSAFLSERFLHILWRKIMFGNQDLLIYRLPANLKPAKKYFTEILCSSSCSQYFKYFHYYKANWNWDISETFGFLTMRYRNHLYKNGWLSIWNYVQHPLSLCRCPILNCNISKINYPIKMREYSLKKIRKQKKN